MKSYAAVPVLNQKGQLTMEPVKVERYRRGQGIEKSSESESEEEVQKIEKPKVEFSEIKVPIEKIVIQDKRVERLARSVNTRRFHSPERIEEIEIKKESSESSESSEYEDEIRNKPVFIPKNVRNPHLCEISGTTSLGDRKQETLQLLEEELMREKTVDKALDLEDLDDPIEVGYELWTKRELSRLQRDYDLRRSMDESKLQVEEKRRTMTETQLRKEEEETISKLEKQRADKPKMKFLQKFYHKGAFFHEEKLLDRNYNEATLEDHFSKDLLPSVLQKRNYGKMSQSKWTHLANEDTSFQNMWHADPEFAKKVMSKQGGQKDPEQFFKRRKK